MTSGDWEFYQNQNKSPPIGYCQSFVDRKWETSNKRRLKDKNRSRNESYDQTFLNPDLPHDDIDSSEKSDCDTEYENEPKKRKYDLI